MTSKNRLLQLVKPLLVIAFAVIVVRLILEFLQVPSGIIQVFGVAWLHILAPIYLALKIADAGLSKPFWALIQATLFFTVPVRLVVAVTYALAYAFQWSASRFSAAAGGPVGGSASPLAGYLGIPATNFLFWLVAAVLFSAIAGGITLLIKRKTAAGGSPSHLRS